MSLAFTHRTLGPKRALLELQGRVTAATAGELRTEMKSMAGAGVAEIVVDLRGVTFLDSSGLAVLVSGLKAAREAGGWLRISGATEPVRSIFSVTTLDRVFGIYPDVASAAAGGSEDAGSS